MARPADAALRRLQHLFSQLSRSATLAAVPRSYSTAITSAKVEVNGVHLHYQQTGNGNHAVLLLPGMLGSGQTDFEPQLKNMNKEIFTVVAWDPRGYGKSIPPVRDYPLDFFERDAKDAVDLMQALKFQKFSLLGWSDGGITALIAAGKHPDLIHKMVVWGANVFVTEEDVKIYNAIRDVTKWSEKVRKPLEEMYGHEYLSKMCSAWVDGISQFTQKSDGKVACEREMGGLQHSCFQKIIVLCLMKLNELSRAFSSPCNQPVFSFSLSGELDVPKGEVFIEVQRTGDICQLLLTHIKCPTLIIHGEKDPLVPRFHAEYIHKHIKGSRLHFMPEGKHNLHLRFAEEFKKMVEEFLV